MNEPSAVDLEMMQRALVLAEEAARRGEIPVGAVVYRDGEVLGEGANRREEDDDPTGHAEIVAMRQAGKRLGRWRLHDCSMAVTLEPCTMCAGAMVNARLQRVVWGADDAKSGGCRSLYTIHNDARLNHRVEGIGGVSADQSVALLQAFFKARRG